jgi:hypothetical protein
MMNGVYASVLNTLTFCTENYFQTLTQQQKKIIAIAALIFSGLAACYTLYSCLGMRIVKEKKDDAPIEQEEGPQEISNDIQDDVLRRHAEKAYSDPQLIPYAQLNEDLILKLEAVDASQEKEIHNTGMTELLVHYAFATEMIAFADLNDLLESLAEEALIYHNPHARLALTQPNNPEELITDKLATSGFPKNTPLALLVKAGNLQGSQLILPVYDEDELLFANPRGNTALHLAILTGQFKLAAAIIKRAKELNCLDELLARKNRVGKTAEDMYVALIESKNPFKNYLDVADENFGGEEVNKALMGHLTDKVFMCRNRLISELGELTPITLPQLKRLTFAEILSHIK